MRNTLSRLLTSPASSITSAGSIPSSTAGGTDTGTDVRRMRRLAAPFLPLALPLAAQGQVTREEEHGDHYCTRKKFVFLFARCRWMSMFFMYDP